MYHHLGNSSPIPFLKYRPRNVSKTVEKGRYFTGSEVRDLNPINPKTENPKILTFLGLALNIRIDFLGLKSVRPFFQKIVLITQLFLSTRVLTRQSEISETVKEGFFYDFLGSNLE